MLGVRFSVEVHLTRSHLCMSTVDCCLDDQVSR